MEKKILNYYTTGEDTEDKTKVMVCFHEEEAFLFNDSARSELMRFCDDTVLYYPADPSAIKDNYEYRQQLMSMVLSMNGLFICVTKKLLETDNFSKQIISFAVDNNVPVLPYFCNPGLYDEWNNFMQVQAIDPFSDDPTQIAYSTKISNWIGKITPLSEDVIEKIWEAFDYKIFLSYRKLDRLYVNKLMQNVHGDAHNNILAFSGIWYDEALTSEGDYNEIIEKRIIGSDLILMLITPNTFEKNGKGEDNYVISTEYPAFEREKAVRDVKIIGLLTPGTDSEHALSVFPEMDYLIDFDDYMSLRYAIKYSLNGFEDPNEKSGEDFYYLGLAYKNGIGTEISLDNSVHMFANSKEKGYRQAIRQLVDICFDETEKAKGEDGYYSPEVGAKLYVELIRYVMDDFERNKCAQTGMKAFEDNILLPRLLRSCGDEELLMMAFKLAQISYGFACEGLKSVIEDEKLYLSIEGEANIEIGKIQYARHIYRDFNPQMREPGAIAYLKPGTENMRLRFNQGDYKLDDFYVLSEAYSQLGDSYYKQGLFHKQADVIKNKISLIEQVGINKMDRSQLFEQADALLMLSEAQLMCNQTYLDEALSNIDLAEELIKQAADIIDDIQVSKHLISLLNIRGNALLCKMDLARDVKSRQFLEQEAAKQFTLGCQIAEDKLKQHENDAYSPMLKYMLGRTMLNQFRMQKSTNNVVYSEIGIIYKAESNLDYSSMDMICELMSSYAGESGDYEVYYNYFMARLERVHSDIALISSNNGDIILLYDKLMDNINSMIDELERDVKKHNDYWLSIARVEIYVAKAKALLLFVNVIKKLDDVTKTMISMSGRFNDIISDIDRALYCADSHANNIYNKQGVEHSRMLLGTMWTICILDRDYNEIIGNQQGYFDAITRAGRFADESKVSKLNDYVR